MRTREILAGLMIGCLSASSSLAADHKVPEPDHTVWVKVDIQPVGTTLYAVPPEGEPPSVRVGTTPCILAADFTWGYKWFRQRWELVEVRSPGNICRAELQPDNTCVLYVSFLAMKDGYQSSKVDVPVALLRDPGKDWERKELWPTEGAVSLRLERTDSKPAPEPAHRVMVAGGGSEAAGTGTIVITADVIDAIVFVDKVKVGVAPLQLVLKEGEHLLEVHKPGCRTLKQTLVIKPDTQVSYRALLKP